LLLSSKTIAVVIIVVVGDHVDNEQEEQDHYDTCEDAETNVELDIVEPKLLSKGTRLLLRQHRISLEQLGLVEDSQRLLGAG